MHWTTRASRDMFADCCLGRDRRRDTGERIHLRKLLGFALIVWALGWTPVGPGQDSWHMTMESCGDVRNG